MSREAMQMVQDALFVAREFTELYGTEHAAWVNEKCHEAIAALKAALAEPTVKEPLQVPAEVAATLTTTDIAWLATCRLTKLWQELGQMRWAGADEGWDRAIEAVRNRLDKECQDVLDWKTKADQSHATAIELLQKMQRLKHD